MKGDFTRSTFRATKHYSSVRMQQGRLQLDSDWNEQVDIQNHIMQAQAKHMIGEVAQAKQRINGVETVGFKLESTPDDSDIIISPGQIYINGTLCELEAGTEVGFKIPDKVKQNNTLLEDKNETLINVETLLVDGRKLSEGQWVEVLDIDIKVKTKIYKGKFKISAIDETPRASGFYITMNGKIDIENTGSLRRIVTYKTQSDYPISSDNLKNGAGAYTAYLDVWQRHITAIEDPSIRETALNLPDTTTRTKTIWQLKLISKTEFENLEKQRQVYLKARVNSNAMGARRLDNHLYRVEIHTPGTLGTATFKWSRDNGAIVSNIQNIDDNSITLTQPNRDLSQAFAPNQWVEIFDENQELQGTPGILIKLTKQISSNKFTFSKVKDSDIVNNNVFQKMQQPRARRWDQITKSDISTAKNWVALENGIEVWFETNPGSEYRTGDYWLIPARTIENKIDWLQDSLKNPQLQPIQGIHHDYCKLGTVTITTDNNNNNNKIFKVDNIDYSFIPLSDSYSKKGGTIDGEVTITKTLTVNSGIIKSKADLSLQSNDKLVTIKNDTGNVGIGTATPGAKLHILAPDKTPAFKISNKIDESGQNFNIEIPDAQSVKFTTNTQQYSFDKKITFGTLELSNIINSTQNLRLQTNGSDKLVIKHDTGDIGIGTDNPGAKLHILASNTTTPAFRISNKIGDSEPNFNITIPDEQNVKLTTTCQQYSFDKKITIGTSNLPGIINSTNDLYLQTQNSDNLIIKRETGNVGIGTEPSAKLHILAGDNKTPAFTISNNNGEQDFNISIPNAQSLKLTTKCQEYNFDKKITINSSESAGILNSTKDLYLQTNNSNNLIIKNDTGNIGIGTEPGAKLHILASNTITPAFKISKQIQESQKKILTIDTSDNNTVQFETDYDAYSFNKDITVDNINVRTGIINSSAQLALQIDSNTLDNNKIIVLDTNGNVGIGTDKPDHKLEVEGNVSINGDTFYQGNQLIISSEDTKTNINDLSTKKATEILQGLNPVTFSNKKDTNARIHAGFIAKNVPDMISTDDSKAIRPMEIIAVLTAILKDHKNTFVNLTETINSQQAQITEMLEKIATLEQNSIPVNDVDDIDEISRSSIVAPESIKQQPNEQTFRVVNPSETISQSFMTIPAAPPLDQQEIQTELAMLMNRIQILEQDAVRRQKMDSKKKLPKIIRLLKKIFTFFSRPQSFL
jgi:Family of unknown function (DUF6519)/Chaperone of endosialidase